MLALATHTRSMAANSTSTVSVEAAINELMVDNHDGEYVLMSSKEFEDVDDLLYSYLMMLANIL